MADIEGDVGREASPDGADASILRAGERVMVLDSRKRRYLVELRPGGEFHTHAGMVSHDDVIGVFPGKPEDSFHPINIVAEPLPTRPCTDPLFGRRFIKF